MSLPCENHPNFRSKVKNATFTSFDRLVKHFGDLEGAMIANSATDVQLPHVSSVVLLCYMYDAPPFKPPTPTAKTQVISDAAEKARTAGVGFWQCNMSFTAEGVELLNLFEVGLD
jgi:hypothetical protein